MDDCKEKMDIDEENEAKGQGVGEIREKERGGVNKEI